jgi:hypothetical protein
MAGQSPCRRDYGLLLNIVRCFRSSPGRVPHGTLPVPVLDDQDRRRIRKQNQSRNRSRTAKTADRNVCHTLVPDLLIIRTGPHISPVHNAAYPDSVPQASRLRYGSAQIFLARQSSMFWSVGDKTYLNCRVRERRPQYKALKARHGPSRAVRPGRYRQLLRKKAKSCRMVAPNCLEWRLGLRCRPCARYNV